jgi:hypothetical protein
MYESGVPHTQARALRISVTPSIIATLVDPAPNAANHPRYPPKIFLSSYAGVSSSWS